MKMKKKNIRLALFNSLEKKNRNKERKIVYNVRKMV